MANLSDKASNVTNKTIADYYRECLPIHRELQEAQERVRSITGTLRTVYKRAKDNGASSKAIARLLKERLQDPDEVTKDLHDYVRARAIISPMPTEQVDMFLDLLKPEIEGDTAESLSLERVFDDGYFAGAGGVTGTNNPHLQGTEAHVKWYAGWMKGQEQQVEKLTPKKRGRPPKSKAGKLDPAAETEAPEPDTDAGAGEGTGEENETEENEELADF